MASVFLCAHVNYFSRNLMMSSKICLGNLTGRNNHGPSNFCPDIPSIGLASAPLVKPRQNPLPCHSCPSFAFYKVGLEDRGAAIDEGGKSVIGITVVDPKAVPENLYAVLREDHRVDGSLPRCQLQRLSGMPTTAK